MWIETFRNLTVTQPTPSHPTRVCGLKPDAGGFTDIDGESHPTRVCGLKHFVGERKKNAVKSHPTRVCGLKQPLHC